MTAKKLVPDYCEEISLSLPEKTSRDSATAQSNFRIANQAELWSLLSRILTFDDPASKSQQLRKAVRKQLDKKAPFDTLPLEERAYVFTKIFAGGKYARYDAERLVSFNLAFEDLQRFNKLSFEPWAQLEAGKTPSPTGLLARADLSAAENLWLASSVLNTPNWSQLADDGPWNDDLRAQFIAFYIEHAAMELTGADNADDDSFFEKGRWLWQELLDSRRSTLPGSFLPNIIVLVEGQTEALVLPTFADLLGINFNEAAVHIEACGGAKQVVKQYLNLKELTVLPVLCVLDADVSEAAEIINDSLRDQDRMLTLDAGEMEDSFSMPAFHRLVNVYLKENGCLESIDYSELKDSGAERLDTLDRLFRIRGLGNFDKIGFAEVVAKNLNKPDVPDDGKRIIAVIKEIHNDGINLRFQ